MVKTLAKVGNSYAIVIDKPILEMLHITPETPLDISTDGDSIVVRPCQTIDSALFMKTAREIMKKHAETFRKLAK